MPGTSLRQAAPPNVLLQAWGQVRRNLLPPRCSRVGCSSGRLANLWSGQLPLLLLGDWFCSPSCAESAVLHHLEQLASTSPPTPRPRHRLPLGLLLLSRGDLSEHQLQIALEAQRTQPLRKIGEWLQALKLVSEQQVLAALGLQWALPLLVSPPAGLPATARLLPAALRRQLHLVPVRFVESTNDLYVATSARIEYTLLAAVEHMLECRVLPCLVSERVMSAWLAHDAHEGLAQHFERSASFPEMARIISSYAARLRCEDLRLSCCGSHIWVRLARQLEVAHLLFRLADSSPEAASPPLPTAV